MSLSDYNDPVEKIAALKAATLDPAILNVLDPGADSPFNVTEDIYVFNTEFCYIFIDGYSRDLIDSDGSHHSQEWLIESGEILKDFLVVLYVKDSDITYSDPITTYQNRLAACYTTPPTTAYGTNSFASNANGAILVQGHKILNSNNNDYSFYSITTPKPIPPNTTLHGGNATESFAKYFNVPDDW